jgi:hypothetical protein
MKLSATAALVLVVSICTVAARDIPLAKVLARPREFNGKRVAVTGYYVVATETSCLFTTRDAAKRFDVMHSVWVEFHTPPVLDSIAGRYTLLVGTFHYDPSWRAGALRGGYGHFNGWPAALLDVTDFGPVR